MARSEEIPSCCCCCNVRTGTYILAFLVLICGGWTVGHSSYELATHETSVDVFQYESKIYYYIHGRSAHWLKLGTGICLVLIGAMAVIGLSKGKATYLIPMLFNEMFKLLCIIVYVGTVIYYWSSVKSFLVQCNHLPEEAREWIKNLPEGWLAFIVFGTFTLVFLLHCFFLSVVYRGYKHIMLQALHHRSRDPEVASISDLKCKDGPIYKPPKYDDIQKVPLVDDTDLPDSKPPPYSTV